MTHTSFSHEAQQVAPEIGRIPDAKRLFSVSRTWIYRAAQDHPALLRKLGRSTLVDLVVLRSIISNLPQADITGRH